MNLVLSMVVISTVCFGICLWHTPNLLRRTAAQLLTRADVIEAAKAERLRRIRFWCAELGVAHEAPAIGSSGGEASGPAIGRCPS